MSDSLTEHLQQSARGSLILLIGQVSSTLITVMAMIIVARILGGVSYVFLYLFGVLTLRIFEKDYIHDLRWILASMGPLTLF